MEYDKLLTNHIGEFGRFQKRVVAILSLREFFSAFQYMGVVFLTISPAYLCKSGPAYNATLFYNNCTFEQRKGLTSPRKADDTGFNPCLTYNLNISESYVNGFKSCENEVGLLKVKSNDTVVCTSWDYDTSWHADTTTTQWDLVCDNEWMRPTIASVYLAGVGVGGFVAAWFSDKFGRKVVLLVCEALAILCSIASIYSPVYLMHIVFKFLLAAFMTGSATSFVFAAEMVGPSWRGFVGAYITLAWSIGYVLLSGIAFAMRFYSWKTLALCLTIPQISYFLLVFCFVPESPRWLYLNKRGIEADNIVKKIANENGTACPENVKINEQNASHIKTTTIIDLLRTPYIRKLTIIGNLNWAAVGFLFWGISMNTSFLGSNPYLTAFISAAVEIPAMVCLPWVIGRYGRIRVYTLCTVTAGILILLTKAIPTEGYQAALISLSMFSKFLVTASAAILWVYTPESYPTCIRSQGLFTSVLSAKVSSFIAPYVILLDATYSRLPLVIFGLPTVFVGWLFVMLPETKDASLMQSIADGETFLKNNWLHIGDICRQRKRSKPDKGHATEDEKEELRSNEAKDLTLNI